MGTILPDGKKFYSAASQIGSKDKTVAWYEHTFSNLPEDARELLENYSQIAPADIENHVLAMRDRAWDIYPFPCIGQFKFLILSLYRQPSYSTILSRLQRGGRYLDIGCCLAQDLRKLVADGAPSENLYGVELHAPFIDVGYDLFRDRATLRATFMQADALELGDESSLKQLVGTVDYIHLGMILHIFGWDKQRQLFENCIKILKPESGSIVLGIAVGDVEGIQGPSGNYMHSDETFKKLWEEISRTTGLRFDCRVSLDSELGIASAKQKFGVDRARRLVFEVERL